MNVLELNSIGKVCKTENVETVALKDVSFSVEKNEFIAIMGESGSGKTALLNVISTLNKQTSGKMVLNGKDISTLKESEIVEFRREKLRSVLQDFNPLDTFANEDNIFLPMVLSDCRPKETKKRLSEVQGLLGIESFVSKYPYEVSGGRRRRIAIARALITKPDLILADKPTSALDSESSDMILDLFTKINKLGQTILMVTHSVKTASFSSRVIFIKDGVVFHGVYKGNSDNKEFMERMNESLTAINSRGVDSEF